MSAERTLRPAAEPEVGAGDGAHRRRERLRPRPVAGILLAAGTSSRMGTNKMLLELAGNA